MEKILLNEAIKEQIIYHIDNKEDKSFSQLYYFLINGKIRFITLKKRDVSKDDILDMPINPKENKIIEIEIEYKNLNKFDTSTGIFIYNECYLVDSMGYHFKIFSYSNDNETNYFVPKIWKKIKLIFLVPDEECEYYFKVNKLNIVEEEIN